MMQQNLYPDNWKQRVQACRERAGGRCEHCKAVMGTLRISRTHNLYFLPLHTSHINHDPWNPEAELRALCPSCHGKTHKGMRGKHATSHKQGYQTVSVARLLTEVRGAGLHITQAENGYAWRISDLSGEALDVLDALGNALHCLLMERMEGQA